MGLADWIMETLRSRKKNDPKIQRRSRGPDDEEEETDELLALEII